MWLNEWHYSFFIGRFWILTNIRRCLVVTWLVPLGTSDVAAHIMCAPYSYALVKSHFIQSHKWGYMCVWAITSLPHALWHNGRGLLRFHGESPEHRLKTVVVLYTQTKRPQIKSTSTQHPFKISSVCYISYNLLCVRVCNKLLLLML